MKRLFQYCIAIGVIALFGCAIKLVDVKQDIPDMQMKGKFPLKVALLISQESLDVDTVTNLGSECIGKSNNFSKYPFGNIFKDVAQGVFSQDVLRSGCRPKVISLSRITISSSKRISTGFRIKQTAASRGKRFFQAEGSSESSIRNSRYSGRANRTSGSRRMRRALRCLTPITSAVLHQ